jgi:hypothetical protein
MTRSGHPRARSVVGDRRPGLLAALVLLFALGAGLLVSAGSAHHSEAARQATVTAAVEAACLQPADHHHQHQSGTEWTPTLGKRLRPAADTPILCVVPARLADLSVIDAAFNAPAVSTSSSDDLASRGVLRI